MITEKQIGLRIITNLNCNLRCNFCYQKNKEHTLLPIDSLLFELKPYPEKWFEYCTIMGGESTLLHNLDEYIKIASRYSPQVRLTTNGILITKDLLNKYKKAGLSGINISIPSLNQYAEITGGDINKILFNLGVSKCIFDNVRVNIPLCNENIKSEIFDMIDFFLVRCDVGITICEDRIPTYSILDKLNKMPRFVKQSDNGEGIILYLYKGKQFAYFAHADKYNDDNLIITPFGAFTKWSDYCAKVE